MQQFRREDHEDAIGIRRIRDVQREREKLLDDAVYDTTQDALAEDEDEKTLVPMTGLTGDPKSPTEFSFYVRPGLATLRARYGTKGTWDARRKMFRSAKMTAIALERAGRKTKVTRMVKGKPEEIEVSEELSEAALEREANSTEEMARHMDEAEAMIALYWRLENRFDDLSEEIDRDTALIYYATKVAFPGEGAQSRGA